MAITKVQGMDIVAEYLKLRQKKKIKFRDFIKKARKKYG
jgi:hypothetical protein